MNRTRLSREYASYLDGDVCHAANRLIPSLITRLAEYLWIHHPDARRVLVATDPLTGETEAVGILGDDNAVLWTVDGSGWEPGVDAFPPLREVDDADSHRERIRDDLNLLGMALPLGSKWSDSWPGRGIRSTRSGVDWEIVLPLGTSRRQLNAEVKLDKEAAS